MRSVESPVLVVGAGPVGLTASLLLSRHGIRHLVVDRRPGPHRAPQAHVVNPRSLEIFRQLGIDTGRLRRLATPREDGGHVSWVTTLTGPELGRLPYERQDDAVLELTPEPIVNLPQHELEPILLAHAVRAQQASVHWRHEWRALDADADGVTSHVVDHERDEPYEIRSRWVLAADGAGSPVRKQVGIAMLGPERLQSFVMIHFEADLRALVRDRPAILYWTLDPEALGSFIAHDIDRTWVFMHPYDPETEATDAFDAPRCAAIVRRAIGRDDVSLTVRDVSPWHMTSQVAERYGSGRVFLIGDSAHRFPPAGGMGMNTGIQDAHNLVWKLRFVDEGWAGAALLDSYEQERRPVAQDNADQSLTNAVRMLEMLGELGLGDGGPASRARLSALLADTEGRVRIAQAIDRQRDHFDMLGLQLGFVYETGAVVPDGTSAPPRAVHSFVPSARPGSRLPHAWIERDGARCSSLDLIAPDACTLLTGPAGASVAAECAARTPGPLRVLVAGRDFTDPGGAWLRTCGLEPDGAVLVRPDQHVAWRSATGAADIRVAFDVVLGDAPRHTAS
jgi:2-polyprenyl-6-methoxyphenol hydroxylase-like FAD-dependent oxidoreductase